MKIKLIGICVMLVLLAAAAAQADTIYEVVNYLGIDSGASPIEAGTWYGSGFTTDASYTLNWVDLEMGLGTNNAGSFVLSLYSDTSGKPGTSMGTLSGELKPYLAGTYRYSGSYALSASTTYWIVAGVSDGLGSYQWRNSGPEALPSPGEYVGYSESADKGASFGAVWLECPAVMTIDATAGSAVPEPATLLGFGLPMLMMGIGKLRGLRK